MSDKHPFNIRWTHVTKDTFMYGTKLKWSSTGVLFENALMPSGIVIHEWKMMTDFQTDVNVPDLPILKRIVPTIFILITMYNLRIVSISK